MLAAKSVRLAVFALMFVFSSALLIHQLAFPQVARATNCYEVGNESIGPYCVNQHCDPPTGGFAQCYEEGCMWYTILHQEDPQCALSCEGGAFDYGIPYDCTPS